MRHFFCYALPVLVIIANSGCSMTQKTPISAISGRNVNPAAETPARLAGYYPAAIQPPVGGYQANQAGALRSGRSAKRFWFPKCTTSS